MPFKAPLHVGMMPSVYKTEVGKYLHKMGGFENWHKWLLDQDMDEDMRRTAIMGVGGEQPESWDKFKNWSREATWKGRENYPEEQWQKIAEKAHLPVDRSIEELELDPLRATPYKPGSTITGGLKVAAQEPDLFISEVWESFRQDMLSTADLLIPDRLISNATEGEAWDTVYDPATKKALEAVGFTELDMKFGLFASGQIAGVPATALLSSLGSLGIKRRTDELEKAGVSKAEIEVMKGAAELVAIGAEFAVVPNVSGAKMAHSLTKVARLKGLGLTDETLPFITKHLEDAVTAVTKKGGMLDETVKGVAVGFFSGEGGAWDKMKEAAIWGGLGLGFSLGISGLMKLLGHEVNRKAIFLGLSEKMFTAEERITVINAALTGDRRALSLISEVAERTPLVKVVDIKVLHPNPEHEATLIEHATLINRIDDASQHPAVRMRRLEMEDEVAIASAELAGQPPPPKRSQEELLQVLQKQEQEIPLLHEQAAKIREATPDAFPKAKSTKKVKDGHVNTTDGREIPVHESTGVYTPSTEYPGLRPGLRIEHDKWGIGTISAKSGDKVTVRFETAGTHEIKPHASWKVQTGSKVSKKTQWDVLMTEVDKGTVDPRDLHIALLAERLQAGDPTVKQEIIPMMLKDVLQGNEAIRDYPVEMHRVLYKYMESPLGTHTAFRWGDMNGIVREVEEKGWAFTTKLPYHAVDDTGQLMPGKGPRGRTYARPDPANIGKDNLDPVQEIFKRHRRAHSDIGTIAREERGVVGDKAFDPEKASLYGRKTRPGETQFHEDPNTRVQIESIKVKLAERGLTVDHLPKELPPELAGHPLLEDIVLVYPKAGYTGQKGFVDGALRGKAVKGDFSDMQRIEHWKEALDWISTPENWAHIIPETPPGAFTDESANMVSRFLKNTPPFARMERFNSKLHKRAILNSSVEDVYGVPEGLQSPLREAGTTLGKDPAALSLVEKQADDTWKIVEGIGEEARQVKLVEDVKNEIGTLHSNMEDSLIANNMRLQVEMGERAQRMAKGLETIQDVVDPPALDAKTILQPITSPTDAAIQRLSNPSFIDPQTGLLDPRAMVSSLADFNAVARKTNKPVALVAIDFGNLKVINDLAGHDVGDKALIAAFRRLKKIGDDHGLLVGRWSRGDEALMYKVGPIKKPKVFERDMQNAFDDILEEVPELVRALRHDSGPSLFLPHWGVATEKGMQAGTLINTAEAAMYKMKNQNKIGQMVQGFTHGRDFKEVTKLGDGRLLVKVQDGENYLIGEGAELLDHIGYAKIVNVEGGEVRLVGKKIAVIKDGKTVYMANNSKQMAILEAHTVPVPARDITPEIANAMAPEANFAIPSLGGTLKSDIEGHMPFVQKEVASHGEMFRHWYRKTRTIALDIEQNYNFPMAKHYDDLELTFQKVHAKVSAKDEELLKLTEGYHNRKNQEMAAKIFLAPKADRQAYLEVVSQTDKELYFKIQNSFNELWERMAIPEKHWDDVFFYAASGPAGELPAEIAEEPWMRLVSQLFNSYEAKQIQPNVGSMYEKLWRAYYRNQYMEPAIKRMKDAAKASKEDLSGEALDFIGHTADVFHQSVDKEFLGATNALARLMGDSPEARDLARKLPTLLLSMQYLSSMGFRPSLSFRNLFQPLITTSPLIGNKATMQGYQTAIKVLRREDKLFEGMYTGKITLDHMKEIGMYPDYSPVPWGDVIEQASKMDGFIAKIHKTTAQGLWMQKKTDQFNRMISFYGAIHHTEKYLKTALEQKKGFEWFAKRADLDMFHEVDLKNWKGMWDKAIRGEGAWKDLLLNHAKRVADDSQFIYPSFANPRAWHSQLAKMGLQYGIWPVNYLDMLLERGFANSAAKGRFWRRLIATQGSLLAVGTVTGMSLHEWVFFNPVMYAGGPFAQYGVNMLSIWADRRPGKAERMGAVTKNMGMQMVPFRSLFKTDIGKAMEYLETQDGAAAMMAFMRLLPWPDEESSEAAYQASVRVGGVDGNYKSSTRRKQGTK